MNREMNKHLKQRYAKKRMTAFVHRELSTTSRRLVAREIDDNPARYKQYIKERDIAQELERRLPAFGKPEAQTLNRVWQQVQAEIAPPPTPYRSFLRPQLTFKYGFGYGLVALFVVMILSLPVALSGHHAYAAIGIPEQPSPAVILNDLTPEKTLTVAVPTVIAQVTDTLPAKTRQANIGPRILPDVLHDGIKNTPVSGTPAAPEW